MHSSPSPDSEFALHSRAVAITHLPAETTPRLARLAWASLALIIAVTFVFLTRAFYLYTMDDSYITFRYALNLAQGHGLVFNAGEYPRAEGTTSPLYAALLAVAPLMDVDVVAAAKWTGAASLVMAVVLVTATTYRLAGPPTLTLSGSASAQFASTSAAAYLLTEPYAVANAVSGMETAPSALAYALFLWTLVHTVRSAQAAIWRPATFLGFSAVLVPMLRPEMGLSVVVVLTALAILASPAVRRITLRASMVFAALGLLYYAIRFQYYGLPLPLPFYVKQGSLGFPGLPHVVSFLRHVAFLLPFLAVGVVLVYRRQRATVGRTSEQACLGAILLAIAFQLAYYATLRHVMGFGFRYFVPLWIGVTIAAYASAAAIIDVTGVRGLLRGVRRHAVLVSLLVVSLAANVRAYTPAHDSLVAWYATIVRSFERIGKSLGAASGSHLRIALNNCGAIPFYAQSQVVDLSGLNNRAIALDKTGRAAVSEIDVSRPHLVALVSKTVHGTSDLFGWERLTHEDVLGLGYSFFGTIPVGRMPDGGGLHLLLYFNSDESLRPVLDPLVRDDIIVRPQAPR